MEFQVDAPIKSKSKNSLVFSSTCLPIVAIRRSQKKSGEFIFGASSGLLARRRGNPSPAARPEANLFHPGSFRHERKRCAIRVVFGMQSKSSLSRGADGIPGAICNSSCNEDCESPDLWHGLWARSSRYSGADATTVRYRT